MALYSMHMKNILLEFCLYRELWRCPSSFSLYSDGYLCDNGFKSYTVLVVTLILLMEVIKAFQALRGTTCRVCNFTLLFRDVAVLEVPTSKEENFGVLWTCIMIGDTHSMRIKLNFVHTKTGRICIFLFNSGGDIR